MNPVMDKNDKYHKLLVSEGYKIDNEAEILSLQYKEEAHYDRIWQGFIRNELIKQSPMTTKKCFSPNCECFLCEIHLKSNMKASVRLNIF